MPTLPVARQELYCKHRANGFVPKKAAVAAGFATGSAIYSELEQSPDVITRIQELIDEKQAEKEARQLAARQAAQTAGEVTGMSIGWVIEQLKINAEDAREAGAFKESNDALKLIGEQFGMWNKGGDGGKDKPADAGALMDMNAIDKMLASSEHLEAPAEVKLIDQAVMMELIEGQGRPNRIPEAARTLETGSETDAAFMDEEDI